jgi:tetratricopeptide (TPR) repeat protein
MEKLRIINPDTKALVEPGEVQNLSPELKSIISLSLSLYNQALEKFVTGEYERAWQYISDAVSLFPYADIPLHFAFELSLELGEYKSAKATLEKLGPFLEEADIRRLVDQMKNELTTYNWLVSGPEKDVDTAKYHRLVHRVLATLMRKEKGPFSSELGLIEKQPALQFQTMQNIQKYMTYLTIPVIVVAFVLLISSNSENNRLNELLSSKKDQIENLDSTLLVNVEELRFEKILNHFYTAYQLADYIECAQILRNHTSLVDTISGIDSSIVEYVCAQLYEARQFLLVLAIPSESSFHIHSYFQRILGTAGEIRRDLKVAFILRYPKSQIYTPPLLRELYDTETDDDQRIEYARKLQNLIIDSDMQNLQFLITDKMISELEQSRGLSASKQ